MFCCAGRASARRLNPEGGAKSDDERSPPREAHTAPGLSQANSSANPQQSPPAASSEARKLVILHFNDVYEIDPREREPVGGVARFTTALKSFEHEDPCVLFSGDFLAPSLLSTSTKGAHMVSFFNQMNIKAMCLGNHDFDHGLDACTQRMAESNFPYLLSNVVDVRTGKQLAGARKTLVLEHAGVRIGLMGLIEEEWLATLNCMEPGEVRYTDYVQAARELEATLRSEERCELVIALTHCRVPNDERLARECPTLDLILGGHDHDSYRKRVGPVPLIKSGTDFRELTRVVLDVPGTPGPRCDAEWNVVQITADFPEDAHAAQLVAELSKELAKTMDMVIGELGTELDFKFAHIRTQETSGSNFVADAMLAAVPGVDLAFMNSGTLRADDVFPVGPLKMRDINQLLPMLDEMCVLALSGEQLLQALENSVSQWPKLEGRFPCVAGVTLEFDGSKPMGSRVLVDSVRIKGEPLQLTGREYSVFTKNYLRSGKDGYDVLKEVRLLKDSDAVPLLPVLMREALAKHHEQLEAALAQPGAVREGVLKKHAIAARVDGRLVNVANKN